MDLKVLKINNSQQEQQHQYLNNHYQHQQQQQQQQDYQDQEEHPDNSKMGRMEDLIDDCGGFGKYQALVLFGICIQKLSVSWSLMQMSYAGYIPDWYCIVGGPSYRQNASQFIPQENTLKECTLNNSNTGYLKESCLSHHYVGSAKTIMTEWDLVCDMKWVKATITAIQMTGVLVGALFAGQMAEVIGRKKSMFGFVLFHSLVNFGAAFSTSWQMFAAFRFSLGIGLGAILVITTPYPMEFLPTKWRPIITVIPAMAIGTSIFAFTAYMMEDWSMLHIACGASGLPFVLCYFFVPESIRWLTLQGRFKEAEKIVGKMASVNGRDPPPRTKQVLKGIYEEEQASASHAKKYTYADLFKSRHLTKMSMAFCFLWFTTAMVHYGISFGATALAGNLEFNIFLLHIVDQPSVLSTFYLNNRFGRKKTCIGLYSVSLIGACGILVAQFGVPSDYRGALVTAFSLFAKAGLGAAWAALGVWSTELYPTVVRSVGSGLLNAAAKVGGIAAPFVIDLDNHDIVAYCTITFMFIMAILVCLLVPESKGSELADSIEVQIPAPTTTKAAAAALDKDGGGKVAVINMSLNWNESVECSKNNGGESIMGNGVLDMNMNLSENEECNKNRGIIRGLVVENVNMNLNNNDEVFQNKQNGLIMGDGIIDNNMKDAILCSTDNGGDRELINGVAATHCTNCCTCDSSSGRTRRRSSVSVSQRRTSES